jgi:hypothetical protein
MYPPEESFNTNHPARGGFDDRLVMGTQLTSLQRTMQITFEVYPLTSQMLFACIDSLMSSAALPLCLLHRGVRLLEYLLGALIAVS